MSVFKPKINDYNVNVLFVLLKEARDDETKEEIKNIIIKKIYEHSYPMFYLINKFNSSKGIIKEIYADVILMSFSDDVNSFDSKLIDEILKHASPDALMNYGAYSCDLDFSERCKKEYYMRGPTVEEFNDFSMNGYTKEVNAKKYGKKKSRLKHLVVIGK